VNFLVRAETFGDEKLIVGRAIDREGAAATIEADHVLRIDVVRRTGATQSGIPVLQLLRLRQR
jgi:hypothetical protein